MGWLFNKNKKEQDNTSATDNANNILLNGVDANDFVFATIVKGVQNVPYNTTILLVNNDVDKTLDFIFNLTNNKSDTVTVKFQKNMIKELSFKSAVRVQNTPKKSEENETKSLLLSAVMLGGNPLLQTFGGTYFNSLFNALSDDYAKVSFNTYYEIALKASYNNQDFDILLNSDIKPEEFVNSVLG